MRTTAHRIFLLAALIAWGGFPSHAVPEASAAEIVRDTALGARVNDHIAAGDVQAYRVPLIAGTVLRVRLSVTSRDATKSGGGSGSGGGGDGGGSGEGGGQAEPEVVVLDPLGATLGSAAADANDVEITVAAAGTYRIEVRAGTFSGGYEVRIEGKAPSIPSVQVNSDVVVAGTPVVVHIDAPAQSSVEVEVRRRSGAAPSVELLTDALGRALTVFVKDARRDRVRLEPVPVAVAGGIDMTISTTGGGSGTYQVRTRVRSATDRPSGGDDRAPRAVVAVLAKGADPAAVAAALGFSLVEVRGDLAVFETPQGHEGSEDEDADEVQASAGVLSAEADLIADMPEGSQANSPVVGSDLGRSDLDGQQALVQTHAAAAHGFATGEGVVVAVLDGGVDATHPYLAGRVLAGWDFVDGDADPSEAKNGIDDDGDGVVDEGYGHGTFIASLVLAAAPGARILPVRVLDTDGRGRVSDIASGITWAVDHGATVLNLSFGTLGGSRTLAAAVRYAAGRGVTVVASTGNDGSSALIDFPAALAGVIAVTSVDATGRRAAFSNVGTPATIAAPGSDLVGAFPDARFAHWSGTSFSAALVSGGAALVLERRPLSPPSRVAALLEARAHAFRTFVPRSDRRLLGAGVLDLSRLGR